MRLTGGAGNGLGSWARGASIDADTRLPQGSRPRALQKAPSPSRPPSKPQLVVTVLSPAGKELRRLRLEKPFQCRGRIWFQCINVMESQAKPSVPRPAAVLPARGNRVVLGAASSEGLSGSRVPFV